MSDKYISIEPWWAGFANVRMSLEIGLAISEITRRKFIIPPAIYFNAINPWDKKETYINPFDIWDENTFKQTFNTVNYKDIPEYSALDGKTYFTGVDKFAKLMLFNDVYKELYPLHSSIGFVLTNEVNDLEDYNKFSQGRKKFNLNYEDKFIHFPRNLFGHFYHSVYGSTDTIKKNIKDKMLKGFKFKREYFDSINFIKQALGEYNAIHVRRGDFIDTRPHTVPLLEQIPIFLNKHLFKKKLPLYIATDEKDKSVFNFLKNDYDIYFLDNFMQELSPLHATIYDQLISSYSFQFLGSVMSTFTDYIHVNRASLGLFTNPRVGCNFDKPELVYDKYPWEEEEWGWDNLYRYYWE
jgi:hypothetical protein